MTLIILNFLSKMPILSLIGIMDGLTGTVPLGEPEEEIHQYSLFEIFGNEENKPEDKKSPRCQLLSVFLPISNRFLLIPAYISLNRIYFLPHAAFDWRADKSILYESMKKQEG